MSGCDIVITVCNTTFFDFFLQFKKEILKANDLTINQLQFLFVINETDTIIQYFQPFCQES